mmetsp:Transcript_2026/g.7889  ORF Transcript_2026/g.7889 Transcript_2026/m.7889 type:complete len:250 (+) Transcript_2026:269-1018(+)
MHRVHASVRHDGAEVRAAEPIRGVRHRVQPERVIVERPLIERRPELVPRRALQNLQPRVGAGKVAQEQPVQPAGSQQRGVHEVRPGRRREHHHPAQTLHAVQFGEKLVDDAIRHAGGVVSAPGRDGVKLVKEQSARRGGGGAPEGVADASLGLPDVLIEQLGALYRDGSNPRRLDRRPDHHRLAAPRRSVQQSARAKSQGRAREHRRVTRRERQRLVERRLDVVEPADGRERILPLCGSFADHTRACAR